MREMVPAELHDEPPDEQQNGSFSVRGLLRNRQVLLVHFNTPQSEHPKGFPDDLRNAKSLKNEHLAFSTISVDDRGPYQVEHFEHANAGGSVGLVVDMQERGSVVRVCAYDGGTGRSGDGFGEDPSEESCAESIDKRNGGGPHGNNEWRVQNYMPLGIFVFLPPFVFNPEGEREISLADVLTDFPDDRIFSNGGGSFLEFNRATSEWTPVGYCDIVPC